MKKKLNKHNKYIYISHIISLILLGLFFIKNVYNKQLNIALFPLIILFMFLILLFLLNDKINKYFEEIKIIKKEYLIATVYITLITLIILYNCSIEKSFLKIFYLVPIILFSATHGKKISLFIATYSSINILIISYINRNIINIELDLLLIVLFFWIAWLIGGFINLEREAKNKLYEMTNKLEKVNNELRNSQEVFKVNFEKSNIGMVINDLEGNIIKANDAFNTMMAYEENELQGKNIYQLRKNHHKSDNNICKKMLDNNIKALTTQKEYTNKYGGTIWVKQNTSIAYDNEKKPIYFLNQMENITEKKLVEARYKEQKEQLEYNILKTKFFSKLSHELKTPLNLIFSALQILNIRYSKIHKDEKSEQIEKYFNIIKQNSYRLLRLVNNIIDLSKIDSNSFNLNLENRDIISVIKKIVFSTEEYVINNKRKIKFTSSIKEKCIACDPFSIERIILNLISNAVKFTNVDDLITISIYERDNNLIIEVADTGIGIKEDKLNLIFEYFRQVDESFSRRTEGSGIGLSIVKSLVELHDGKIWVESVLGKGSTFYIALPIRLLPEDKNLETDIYNNNLMDKVKVEFSDIYSDE
ncbi:PAS domain-containing sensor histidine kinase [Natronospora cellulosivora (SeqCode)]